MSRNPHEPTDALRKEVSSLTSFGVTQSEIADYLGVDDKTLRKYYRDELTKSAIRANAAVARVLFEKAVVQKETVAAIFWAKTRMRWSDRVNLEITGKDGNAVEIETKYSQIDEIMKERFKLILNKEVENVSGDESQ